jgi:hypothetical protein
VNGKRERFEPLDRVKELLEKGIRQFKTEPDIMLAIEGKLIVCIEAKFGSGNSLAYEAPTQPHVKPTAPWGGNAGRSSSPPCDGCGYGRTPKRLRVARRQFTA